jgi:hypothetical protein
MPWRICWEVKRMSYHTKTKDLWGCFRCGTLKPEFEIQPTGHAKCLECLDYGIVTIEQAFDYMNGQYAQGKRIIAEANPDLEDIEMLGFDREEDEIEGNET